jgi:hypothetical protein
MNYTPSAQTVNSQGLNFIETWRLEDQDDREPRHLALMSVAPEVGRFS